MTQAVTESEQQLAIGAERVTLVTLTAMVVGSMVGAGVFSLPGRFAVDAGPILSR